MDAQTKNKIIAEITAAAVKTVEQTVRESLKKALVEDFVEKTTDKAVKRIKSFTVEFKNKGKKSVAKKTTSSWKKLTKQ